jgi:DNA recombination protein RmuC
MVRFSLQLVRFTSVLSVTFDLLIWNPTAMDVMLYVLLGLLAGLVAGWMAAKRSQKSALDQQANEHKAALDALREEMGRQQQSHAEQLKSAQEMAHERESRLEASLQELRDQHQMARDQAIRLESELLPLKEKLNDRQKDLEETREALNTQFKVLSNSILDQQSTKFSEQNKKQIDGLLGPLKERITEFEKKVDEKYLGEAKDREGLKSQIQSLVEQSKRLEQEARDLTTALKGDNKTQGNWGELVLTRVLESSGLREGTDFVLQYTERDQANSLKKPDVVVHLPDGKHIIVDAKV